MSEPIEDTLDNTSKLTSLSQNRFLLLVFGSIGISLVLVTIALSLYVNSTAIELDLSRPAYQSVREQAGKDIPSTSFSSSGPIDKAALEQYRELYKDQYEKAVSTNGFVGEALSDQALELPHIQSTGE